MPRDDATIPVTADSTPFDGEQPQEERRLTPLQVKILYFLYRRKKFRGSILGMSKEMGYESDGKVNPALHYLVDKKYAREEPTETGRIYSLEKKGRDEIIFLILPNYLLLAILVIGLVDVYVAYAYFVLHVPLNPYSDLIGGAAMIAMAYVLLWAKRGMVKRFLDLRDPISD